MQQFNEEHAEAETTTNTVTTGGGLFKQFNLAPPNFQIEEQKRRKTMGPLQFSQS
jgi:hypothetical protein